MKISRQRRFFFATLCTLLCTPFLNAQDEPRLFMVRHDYGFVIDRKIDPAMRLPIHLPNKDTNIAGMSVGHNAPEKHKTKSDAIQAQWKQVLQAAYTKKGLGKIPETGHVDAERFPLFTNIPNARNADEAAWKKCLGQQIDFSDESIKNSDAIKDGVFIARVLTNIALPKSDLPADSFQRRKEHITYRTLPGFFDAAALSASIGTPAKPNLYTGAQGNADDTVGVFLNVPLQNILSSTKIDTWSPLPGDFLDQKATCRYGEQPKRAGFRLISLLSKGLTGPETMLDTPWRYNELYFAPQTLDTTGKVSAASITGFFAVTNEPDPAKWTGKQAAIRERAISNGVPLLRFSKPAPKSKQKLRAKL